MNTQINYIELYSNDLTETKRFYNACFGWEFIDYGDSYVGINGAGIDGGFELTDKPIVNGALVILHHDDLEIIKSKIIKEGGKIVVDIFSFPGGKRFHFLDPSGNILGVWKNEE